MMCSLLIVFTFIFLFTFMSHLFIISWTFYIYSDPANVTLDVPRASSYAEGQYSCNVTSSAGYQSATTYLDISGQYRFVHRVFAVVLHFLLLLFILVFLYLHCILFFFHLSFSSFYSFSSSCLFFFSSFSSTFSAWKGVNKKINFIEMVLQKNAENILIAKISN